MIKYTVPGIGQGCCVEQIAYLNCDKYRILYDCGTERAYTNALQSYIDTIDTGIPTILVISHLHYDHISGIPYLLNHFKKNRQTIKKLYLPLYSHDILTLFAMSIVATGTEASFEEDNRLIRFIFRLENMDSSEDFGSEFRVFSHENEENQLNRKNIFPDTEYQKISESTTDVCWAIKFWVDPDVYSILPKSDTELLRNIKPEEFDKEERQNEIKKKYLKIVNGNKNKLNLTSMLMASYFQWDYKAEIIYLISGECMCFPHFFYDGFVCTGDYPFRNKRKVQKIHDYYSDQQILLNKMMVPHHGSGNKYCKYIPFDFIKTAYAQNGENNIYGHPGKNTINFLEGLGIKFINVQNRIY